MGCEASLAQRHVSVMIDPKQNSRCPVTLSYNFELFYAAVPKTVQEFFCRGLMISTERGHTVLARLGRSRLDACIF
jgi:hypothetical protein